MWSPSASGRGPNHASVVRRSSAHDGAWEPRLRHHRHRYQRRHQLRLVRRDGWEHGGQSASSASLSLSAELLAVTQEIVERLGYFFGESPGRWLPVEDHLVLVRQSQNSLDLRPSPETLALGRLATSDGPTCAGR